MKNRALVRRSYKQLRRWFFGSEALPSRTRRTRRTRLPRMEQLESRSLLAIFGLLFLVSLSYRLFANRAEPTLQLFTAGI